MHSILYRQNTTIQSNYCCKKQKITESLSIFNYRGFSTLLVRLPFLSESSYLCVPFKTFFSKRFYPGRGPRLDLTALTSNVRLFHPIPVRAPNSLRPYMPRQSSPLLCSTSRSITFISPARFPLVLTSNPGHYLDRAYSTEMLEDQTFAAVVETISDSLPNNNSSTNPSLIVSPPQITLKNNSNKEYTTAITQETTAEQLTTEELILELKKRELIKTDDGNAATTILLQDNSNFLVGGTKNGIKLSQTGLGYLEKKENQEIASSTHIPIVGSLEKVELIIIVPPESMDNLFLETSREKHLFIVHDLKNDSYYATGYLTSQKSDLLVCKKQLKYFQNEQDNLPLPSKVKEQYFVKFNVPRIINNEDIRRVKGDKEYLNQIDPKIRDRLKNMLEFNNNSFGIVLNKQGITKDDCLQMCKDFDKNVKENVKHPLSSYQIKKNEENKEKQNGKEKEQHKNETEES